MRTAAIAQWNRMDRLPTHWGAHVSEVFARGLSSHARTARDFRNASMRLAASPEPDFRRSRIDQQDVLRVATADRGGRAFAPGRAATSVDLTTSLVTSPHRRRP